MGKSESTTEERAPEVKGLSKSREADWPAVLFFIHIHLLSLYGLWVLFFEAKYQTVLFLAVLVLLSTLGVMAGAHRLWAHATYEASAGLRLFLVLCHTLTGQGSVYEWVRYHRLHHDQFATDDDPYNYKRGFLYASILTRLRKLSLHQEHLLDNVDMSDLENDSIVMFQKKFYWLLYGIFFLLLPLNTPLEYWDESVLCCVMVIGFLRYALVLHAAWLVESAITVWGLKPGQKYPPDSNSVFVLAKTFWPHYHYLIPYDYKSGEYGTYDGGCSTTFIRVWAALGLATNLKTMETKSLQEALAEAAYTGKPLKQCLDDAAKKQQLPYEHYLIR